MENSHHNPEPLLDPNAHEAVHLIEELPYTHAFEYLMYDQRYSRHAGYKMEEPLTLYDQEIVMAQELRDLFPFSGEMTVEQLHAQQFESDDPNETTTEMSFTVDEVPHHLVSTAGRTTYTVEREHDTAHYTFEGNMALSLLATFLYMRQRTPKETTADDTTAYGLDQAVLDFGRPADVALTEQLIMALGAFDGQSFISTESMFTAADGQVMIAKLGESESPTMSGLQSKLDISVLDPRVPAEQTILHQNEASVTAKVLSRGIHRTRYAERIYDPEHMVEITRENYEEWSRVCAQFLGVIREPLELLSHLDEEE